MSVSNQNNTMLINGVSVKELKEKFGTPLYVYDENHLIKNILDYKENFKSNKFETEVIFASKSFNVKEMLRLTKKLGLSLDCVSYGELYTAQKVNYNPHKIYMHGNNKSYEEIKYCIDNEVNIVVDNYDELELISELSKEKKAYIYIRINVGVDAHTHKFIVTSHIDSKFGVIYGSSDYLKMIDLIKKSNIEFLGYHAHIGSQIFDINAFYAEIDKLLQNCKELNKPINLDLGGGFGVSYTNEDAPIPFKIVSQELIKYLEKKTSEIGVKINKVLIEPGRSIVAEAGYTLYTIGFMKKTPNKKYYFIDGGMTDNIRPALYQAKYAADIATKINEPKNEKVCIAGKCCESGDVIIENIDLQKAEKDDLLVTYTTGAYGYSMSSNYNKAPKPGVVFIKDGKARLVVKRETYEEMIEREI